MAFRKTVYYALSQIIMNPICWILSNNSVNDQEKGQVLQKKEQQKFKNNLGLVIATNWLCVTTWLTWLELIFIRKYSVNKLTGKLHSRYVKESEILEKFGR